MKNHDDVYDTEKLHLASQRILQFYFLSQGKKNIIKAVQYQYMKHFKNRPLFNLGLSNYDPVTEIFSDEDVSNNDDHYKVFHTVLSTVPALFDVYGDVMLMVQGSDSNADFINRCRNKCSRKCDNGICKKAHRRINIYRGFVDKYFELLTENYVFHGGDGIEDHDLSESYIKGKKYKAVLVMRKNRSFIL